MPSREQIRQKIRALRSQLDPGQQQHASDLICRHLAKSWMFQRADRIAFYLPYAGEVDLKPLINYAWHRSKSVYLPILGLRYSGQLWFARYQADTPLYTNRFGIAEPSHSYRDHGIKPRQLDMILMPLVAFDALGHRLGMGGGFYDKTLTMFARQTIHWRRPRRIGIAYTMQKVPEISAQAWDIPIDAVATEDGLFNFT